MANITKPDQTALSETRIGAIQGVSGWAASEVFKWGIPILSSTLLYIVAWLKGLVFPWNIFFALGVTLVLAVLANFISLILVRHRRSLVPTADTELVATSYQLAESAHQPAECPDKPLHAIAGHDQNHINEAVSVESCKPEYFLKSPSPYVDFIFTVFNGSVYRVSVGTPIEGNIIILNYNLSGRLQLMRNEVANLHRCSRATFCVRQWLNAEESNLISEASDGEQFLFIGLHVPINGGDYYPNVQKRNLKLVRGVQKDGRPLPDF